MHEPLSDVVRAVVDATPVLDMHTHLFAPELGALGLSGIDELLTYHYLLTEFFRSSDLAPETFFALPKPEQADRVWRALFVESSPVAEAASGVVLVLRAFGLDPAAPDLREARAFFAAQEPRAHLDRVLELAGVSEIVMTNDPLDPEESALWLGGARPDRRFRAALRLDPLLLAFPRASALLAERGYDGTPAEVRRFLDDWIARLSPAYLAVSLPGEAPFPEASVRRRLLEGAVLPACEAHGLPLALMLGVRRGVNPRLRLGGDGLERTDLRALEQLAGGHPRCRFLVTVLGREDQHGLCVVARKFANVMPFGCWWFVNNPSIALEITRERLELLGLSFIPQHSDARVLEQLIYKWRHSRRVVGEALVASYAQLEANGRRPSRAEIERDVGRLFSHNFRSFAGARA